VELKSHKFHFSEKFFAFHVFIFKKSLIAINRQELKIEKVQKFKLALIKLNEFYNLFI